MDDATEVVPPEEAARILRADRTLMLAGWALILFVSYFCVSELLHPGQQLLIFIPIAIALGATYFLLSSRCPRCHREFFAEKAGIGVMFGRFRCVACGYNPAANESSGQSP
jgi:hypothetical protein